jgi:hypothetical protein
MNYSVHIIPRTLAPPSPASVDPITGDNYIGLANLCTPWAPAAPQIFAVFVDELDMALLRDDLHATIVNVLLDPATDSTTFLTELLTITEQLERLQLPAAGIHLIGYTPFEFDANHLRTVASALADYNLAHPTLPVRSVVVATDADLFSAPTFNLFHKEDQS